MILQMLVHRPGMEWEEDFFMSHLSWHPGPRPCRRATAPRFVGDAEESKRGVRRHHRLGAMVKGPKGPKAGLMGKG